MTTPFDDPQAELAWMFLQCLSEGGDVDECFELLNLLNFLGVKVLV